MKHRKKLSGFLVTNEYALIKTEFYEVTVLSVSKPTEAQQQEETDISRSNKYADKVAAKLDGQKGELLLYRHEKEDADDHFFFRLKQKDADGNDIVMNSWNGFMEYVDENTMVFHEYKGINYQFQYKPLTQETFQIGLLRSYYRYLRLIWREDVPITKELYKKIRKKMSPSQLRYRKRRIEEGRSYYPTKRKF